MVLEDGASSQGVRANQFCEDPFSCRGLGCRCSSRSSDTRSSSVCDNEWSPRRNLTQVVHNVRYNDQIWLLMRPGSAGSHQPVPPTRAAGRTGMPRGGSYVTKMGTYGLPRSIFYLGRRKHV